MSFSGVLVKDFDGWATVILPVDVTVQQSGVLCTNSNKMPEKTHKCLSPNDRDTEKRVLVKDFDGWATVILPVDVTVQQSGVLRTNSNKTPEKTHKCLSPNDRGTKSISSS